jgi:hypothetical protein
MLQLLKTWILISAGIFFAVRAEAAVYTYDISNMNSDAGADFCDKQIREAANLFQKQGSVRVLGAECRSDFPLAGLRGRIVYSASQPLAFWSTNSTTYGKQPDLFYSRQQCESSLTQEVELVRRHTGLEPFLAFCHKTSNLGSPRYRSRIDAIGASDFLRMESAAQVNFPLVAPRQTAEALHQQGLALGLIPIAWYHGPMLAQRNLVVAYYAQTDHVDRYNLLSRSSLYLANSAECAAASEIFERTRSTEWVGVWACSAPHPAAGFQFNIFWWDKAIAGDLVIRSTMIPGTHESFDSCRKASLEVASQLSQDGAELVGIVCGRENSLGDPIRMEVLTRLL